MIGARSCGSPFRRGFALTLVFDVLARGLSALAVVLLVRGLSATSFAFMSVFIAAGQVSAGALCGGVQMQYVRAEAERVSRGGLVDEASLPGYLVAQTAIVAAVGLGVAAFAMLGVIPRVRHQSVTLLTLLVVAYVVGQTATDLAVAHHQAHQHFRGGVLWIVRNSIIVAATLLVTAGLVSSGLAVAILYALAAVIAAALSVASLPVLRAALRRVLVRARDALRTSGWLSIYFLTSAIFSYCDVLVVGALRPAPDVAAFGAAQRYFAVAIGAIPALLATLRIRTAQSDVIDSATTQRTMIVGWMRRSAPPALALLGVLEVLAGVIVHAADGGRYPASVAVFRVLIVLALLSYLTTPLALLLMAQGRHRFLAGSLAVAAALNVGADIWAARYAGIVTVAALTTILYGAVSCGQLLALRSRFSPRTPMPAERDDDRSALRPIQVSSALSGARSPSSDQIPSCVLTGERYATGGYLEANPTWHVEDSAWKAANVDQMARKHALRFDSVCEVGCGAGEVLRELSLRNDQVSSFVGYDTSPDALAMATTRAGPGLEFRQGDASGDEDRYGLLLLIDVIEHVEDCIGFMRSLRARADHTIIHVPIEISLQSVVRRHRLMRSRERVGHIHFFTDDLALAAIRDAGYMILDVKYTYHGAGRPKSLLACAVALPRLMIFRLSPRLTARLLGGCSLLVLATPSS